MGSFLCGLCALRGESLSVDKGRGQFQDSKFKRKATMMPINHHEIIEDLERQTATS